MTDTPSWVVPVRAAIREGRWSEAARHCQDLLARNPDETDAWFVLGMLHERQK